MLSQQILSYNENQKGIIIIFTALLVAVALSGEHGLTSLLFYLYSI